MNKPESEFTMEDLAVVYWVVAAAVAVFYAAVVVSSQMQVGPVIKNQVTGDKSMNSLFVIAPFWKDGTWVFNDDSNGLKEEPFVAGTDDIISGCVKDIPNAKDGFRLTFSATEFPGYHIKAERLDAEAGGYWYIVGRAKGWLCPATLCYFPDGHPEELYVKFDSLNN